MKKLSNSTKIAKLIFLSFRKGFSFGLGYKPNFVAFHLKDRQGVYVSALEDFEKITYSTSDLFFNLDFARAIFGDTRYEKQTIEVGQTSRVNPRTSVSSHTRVVQKKVSEGWQFHLKKLALLEDAKRLDYVFNNRQER